MPESNTTEYKDPIKILVAYASKHGSTKGIAEFIGEKFKERGIEADVSDVDAIEDLKGYNAFVVGSAVYMGHWMKQAESFVFRNRAVLSAHPVWLFSSGPVGKEKADPQGRDLLETSEPKELGELQALTRARDHKVFYGALDGKKLTGIIGVAYRAAQKIPSAKQNMPEGDFRDWKEIESWASSIAARIETAK